MGDYISVGDDQHLGDIGCVSVPHVLITSDLSSC